MKYDLLKCDWCGKEERLERGTTTPTNWTERKGTHPREVRDAKLNEKYMVPTVMDLHFCGNSCNQTHKDVEAEAQKAANEAWITIYNRKSV